MKMILEMQKNFAIDATGFVHVYANGDCCGNGKPEATAEIDVWFANNHYLNILQPIPDGYRPTNQVAEILAVTMAATQATSAGVKRLRIHTESKYILFCVRRYMRKWRENGWINAKGNAVVNKKELMEMDDALKPLKVKWMWRNFYTDVRGFVHVYTDGACFRNGKTGATAGIGVYFENYHDLNISQHIPPDYRDTSQVAEMLAVKMAAIQATNAEVKKLKIHTDSKFVLNCVKKWIYNWIKYGWINSQGNPVVNQKELREMLGALRHLKVKWKYVPAHKNIYGNVQADKLARAGASEHHRA